MRFESRSSRLSFFGRFADELTRMDISKGLFQVSLSGSSIKAHYKDDGYFAFANLTSSTSPYSFAATSTVYRNRTIAGVLPVNTAVELAFPGEDELILLTTTIDTAGDRVNFDVIPFLPTIEEGATVLGPGGFSTTLSEVLEGNDVDFARLTSVAGLTDGDPLRFLRSRRMLLRPGAYYSFPGGSTLLAVTVVENTAGAESVAGARIRITEVNGQVLIPAVVGGLSLNTVSVPALVAGDPPIPVMLGPAEAITTTSNTRGDAVFYYPGSSLITALTLEVSRAGYITTTVPAALTSRQRTHLRIPLPRA